MKPETVPTESYRIVVLGGPAAGKTVFLASLYHHLWMGFDGMTMRAATGAMHSDLLTIGAQISSGVMPPATQALRHLEFELEDQRHSYSLRFLDYPGELFRKVFYDTVVDTDEAHQLYEISTNADGIIALVDPASILDGTWDIDFALTNLIRFYKAKDRKQPELVLAFTKRDRTHHLVGKRVISFLRKHLPHLSRELVSGLRVQHFCSIIGSNGQTGFASAQAVTAPLRSVIDLLEGQRSRRNLNAFLKRLAWQRAAFRTLAILLFSIVLLVAFSAGSLCRPSSTHPNRQGTNQQ